MLQPVLIADGEPLKMSDLFRLTPLSTILFDEHPKTPAEGKHLNMSGILSFSNQTLYYPMMPQTNATK